MRVSVVWLNRSAATVRDSDRPSSLGSRPGFLETGRALYHYIRDVHKLGTWLKEFF
ncbi:MAG: hypothetical protein CM1200mP14_20170 [Gammaproteobacteria bacterium]|nr:MAG: hypothetical protein CM1200mP14_20170 [Gammaproteobacteria bacterium]